MNLFLEKPSPWILDQESELRRIPKRPAEFRQANFSELFDDSTVFYDCVWLEAEGQAVLLGPPLLNLGGDVGLRLYSEANSGIRFTIRNLDRHSQIWVTGMNRCGDLSVKGAPGHFSLQLNRQRSFFNGKRVLMTINKDNPILWICDWIRYHRDVHGADAVLIYDNGSRSYSENDLAEALQKVPGLDSACVVSWPFKFGPQGFNGKFWDSDFCQFGALEHARWRFLQGAKCVLASDIDELVITNGPSIFELAESQRGGYVAFNGRWAVADPTQRPPSSQQDTLPRHADYSHCVIPEKRWAWRRLRVASDQCPCKWAVVPSRCKRTAQWRIHQIGKARRSVPDVVAGYRHFRDINTSWKYNRKNVSQFAQSKRELDARLIAAFKRVQWNG